MTSLILTAMLAMAAADNADSKSENPAPPEASKQLVTTVVLDGSEAEVRQKMARAGGMQVHRVPPGPPLVAIVQPDGSISYTHAELPKPSVEPEQPQ